MLDSLSRKITALGLITATALSGLAALLLYSSWKMESGYRRTQHTERVLELAQRPVDIIRRSESDLRASIIERKRSPEASSLARLEEALADLRRLVRSTADNPEQNARARALLNAAEKRIELLRSGIALQTSGAYPALPFGQVLARSRASEALMADLDAKRDDFLVAERLLLQERTARAERLFRTNRLIVLVAVPVIVLIILAMKAVTIRSIRRHVRSMIVSIEAFAAGDGSARIDLKGVRWREFASIAAGYNTMADTLSTTMKQQVLDQSALEIANKELRRQSVELEKRGAAMDTLNAMSLRMTSANSDPEFAEVIRRFVPKLLPGTGGAVYAHSNSRNQLVKVGSWGNAESLPEWFEPEKCWGLRLVKPHVFDPSDPDLACEHARAAADYCCEPLMAGGDVVGLVHVIGSIPAAEQYRLAALSREVGSGLMNHVLRRDLREQSIRDPLTNLFNRRYLEESLQVELARAERSEVPLSVIMCDVDHFKRFNDTHGHDAGDAVLRAVAEEMQKHFRDGDIVCRYGGEEFTVIAAGATTETAARRVERLRLALGELVVRSGNTVLPPISASFGIAGFVRSEGSGTQRMLEAADEAVYRAKRQGRNRAVIAELRAA
ncbi:MULTISPECIES: sensor domain-containing diguanylate cyclase [unclassified Sphingomonas]|uniref:sensor domain-containing diguanylate cyclase n=1 Tax=unclassified Sphingomonas TaxID=196159 RepID=UPI0003179A4B|nr:MULTISPECIES: diguanylate cyclase [unclassified Sphingomonas]KTF67885.1 hypothetical protein ATB93_16335 [Sphingomonas sp. WG]